MSDLQDRLLAAVKGHAVPVASNPKSGCKGVRPLNSLAKSGVRPAFVLTPELPNRNSDLTPLHLESANRIENGGLGSIAAPGNHTRALSTLRDRCPELVDEYRWQEAIADADSFLADWGEKAAALSWTDRDLLGLPPVPEKPASNYRRLCRYDEIGLIWFLRGRPVVALTEDTAAIENPSGAVTVYRKNSKWTPGPVPSETPERQAWNTPATYKQL